MGAVLAFISGDDLGEITVSFLIYRGSWFVDPFASRMVVWALWEFVICGAFMWQREIGVVLFLWRSCVCPLAWVSLGREGHCAEPPSVASWSRCRSFLGKFR